MAEGGFGKIIKEETSSSSSTVPLITRRTQILGTRNPQYTDQPTTSRPSTSAEGVIPRKAINILRSECKENRRKSRTKLIEILMDRRNPDAGKTIVVDIDSEDEFDEALNKLKKKELPLKKRIWFWKVDDYSQSDSEFQKNKFWTHKSVNFGVKNLDELKSMVSLEYSNTSCKNIT